MSRFYRNLLRPVLFRRDAEAIHEFAMRWLGRAAHSKAVSNAIGAVFRAPDLPVDLFGLRFPNPVGLAAGMDKDAAAVPIWAALGFGFCELGAVTAHAQPGNPRPRIFRAVPDEAIVNRMGFNNLGATAFADKLARWRTEARWPAHPVGINLGKSKVTPLAEAAADYAASFRVLQPLADFFVVNVSSPNTPNLRQLQDRSALDEILAALQEVNGASVRAAPPVQPPPPAADHQPSASGQPSGSRPAAAGAPRARPLLVKVAPDLSFSALDEILELVTRRQVAGLVATNTTTTRPTAVAPGLQRVYAETGGLSGRPLAARSTEVIRHLYRQTQGRVPLVGVGGIFNADDAWEKITAGASLVQVYTGFVFEGPGLSREIVQGLRARLASAGLQHLSQAVGIAARPTPTP